MTKLLQKEPQVSRQRQLGLRIQLARVSARLSQRQLAEVLFVSQSMVSLYERGETIPNALTLQAIAAAVGQELDFFKV